jgi:O-antigen ligase
VGVNQYPNVALRYDDTEKQISKSFKPPVHNVYLLALTETGLVGLVALLAYVLSIFGLASFFRWPFGEVHELHLGFFCGFLASMIHAGADLGPPGSNVNLLFLIGLLGAVHAMGHRPAAALRAA